MIGLLYGAGLRLNELRMLKVSCIDSAAMQIKVVQGKGNKDRFTILPSKGWQMDLREKKKQQIHLSRQRLTKDLQGMFHARSAPEVQKGNVSHW